jgi:hypothetical protein
MKPDKHKEVLVEKPLQKNKLELRLQRIADILNKHANQLPARHLRVLVLCIGIIGAAICLMLIIKPRAGSFMNTATQPAIIQPKMEQNNVPSLPQADYLSLIRIKKTLDSLSHTPEGKNQLNQWLKQNAGLLDSLNFLLESYQHEDLNNQTIKSIPK